MGHYWSEMRDDDGSSGAPPHRPGVATWEEIDRLTAEVEQLKAERGDWQAMARIEVFERLGQLRLENERLKAEVKRLQSLTAGLNLIGANPERENNGTMIYGPKRAPAWYPGAGGGLC